jgi:ankyrin repeat protein
MSPVLQDAPLRSSKSCCLLVSPLQAVVSLLLSSGANPNTRDNLGSSALLEAVKAGQAGLLGLLVGAGAALQLSNSELSSALCSMVVEGQAGLLRRYIAAGANVAAGDYNQQTPLHIAAVQGKLEMVSALTCLGDAPGLLVGGAAVANTREQWLDLQELQQST